MAEVILIAEVISTAEAILIAEAILNAEALLKIFHQIDDDIEEPAARWVVDGRTNSDVTRDIRVAIRPRLFTLASYMLRSRDDFLRAQRVSSAVKRDDRRWSIRVLGVSSSATVWPV